MQWPEQYQGVWVPRVLSGIAQNCQSRSITEPFIVSASNYQQNCVSGNTVIVAVKLLGPVHLIEVRGGVKTPKSSCPNPHAMRALPSKPQRLKLQVTPHLKLTYDKSSG